MPKAHGFLVQADSKVFVHGCAATPSTLLSALGEYGRRVRLRDVELVHIHTAGDLISSDPENEGRWNWFRSTHRGELISPDPENEGT